MMNTRLALQILQRAIDAGVKEFCLAPGKRNAPLVYALAHAEGVKTYYWPEERSAAFFALGRIRATDRPVAVITTSGTAAAELLPAAMESYYTHLPLLLMTADRPRRLRGTGAPQCAEQVGMFSYYARYMQDIALEEDCPLHKWSQQGPAHLNICFDEPKEVECQTFCQGMLNYPHGPPKEIKESRWSLALFEEFLSSVRYPLVVIGALRPSERESVAAFLLKLKAPVYAEGPSGLREDPRLAPWRVGIDQVWARSSKAGYPIDGVLRIGSIPTGRIWRDLDEKNGAVKVCSISELPFSGLSWAEGIYTLFDRFHAKIENWNFDAHYPCQEWLKQEKRRRKNCCIFFMKSPRQRPVCFIICRSKSLINRLSIWAIVCPYASGILRPRSSPSN